MELDLKSIPSKYGVIAEEMMLVDSSVSYLQVSELMA
jgi:hypothetical protein